jgi:hypothetical protein
MAPVIPIVAKDSANPSVSSTQSPDDRHSRKRHDIKSARRYHFCRRTSEENILTVYDTFVQDGRAHYDVVPLGTVFNGIEGVRGFYQSRNRKP